MSHYISANLDGRELEFCIGLNWRSISALQQSGWCIYENYENFSELEESNFKTEDCKDWYLYFNRGVSGSGHASKVNDVVAARAYKKALLWTQAFREAYPELYLEQYQRAVEIYRSENVDFNTYLSGMKLKEEDIQEELKDLIQRQKLLSMDERERAFQSFWRVISFSYQIYIFTSNGKEIEVYYS